MIASQTCVTLICDGCAVPLGDEDGGPWHFTTDTEAVKLALNDCEWTEDAEGRLRCRTCSEKAVCAADGHDWGDWHRCLCGGGIEKHRGGMTSEHRGCSRCGAAERQDIVGDCEQPYQPTKLSDGARLIEHRRNHYLLTAAHPERDHEPHVVPVAVEDLVEQGAQLAARIDAALPEDFYVR